MAGRRTHVDVGSSFSTLAGRCGRPWTNLVESAHEAQRQRLNIAASLGKAYSSDASLVVFGSLARDEFTSKSDVDWTLLVDGQADSQHVRAAQAIERKLVEATFVPPGTSGTFGEVAFSHSLIHDIGGSTDTNANTTRRMLLLLESAAVGNSEALDRVQRGVLLRYLEDDLSYVFAAQGQPLKLPRFLLNDLVRFWRTMAVDFASKHRAQPGKKWAIRNVKLRFSRKLIFAAGLVSCFDCTHDAQEESGTLFGPTSHLLPVVSSLYRYARTTPIEVLAQAIVKAEPKDPSGLFDAYDHFIGTLRDEDKRQHLSELNEDRAASDPLFMELRDSGHRFATALEALFYDTEHYGPLTRHYGLF